MQGGNCEISTAAGRLSGSSRFLSAAETGGLRKFKNGAGGVRFSAHAPGVLYQIGAEERQRPRPPNRESGGGFHIPNRAKERGNYEHGGCM